MIPALLALTAIFGELSLLAFGGATALLPEMQRQVVDIHHWMSAEEFSALFALAQAAPGPNMMIVPLLGERIAGPLGALVTLLAIFIPSSILFAFVLHLWRRFKDQPWRRYIQTGLAPVTIGLIVSSAFLITRAADQDWALVLVTAATAAATLWRRHNPLYILGGGAVAGLAASGLF